MPRGTGVCAVINIRRDVQAPFPRVEYDIGAAARAIEAIDLPHEFAEALRAGDGEQ